MKARPKLSCFWIAVLLWGAFLLVLLPIPGVPWQRYGPDPHWENGPFIIFLFGVAVLFAGKHILLALKAGWDWLGRDDSESSNENRS